MGLDTFGDVTADASGRLLSHAPGIRDVIEGAVLADSIGIEQVYRICSYLPLAGLLAWLLPRIEDHR